MKLFRLLKDILAPKKCYSCQKEGHFLCLRCLQKLHKYEEKCFVCKNPSLDFIVHKDCQSGVSYDQCILLTHYSQNVIKKLITDGKFYKRKDIFEDFGIFLSKLLRKHYKYSKNDTLVIAVPMSLTRRLMRGYNHSEILAKSISELTGLKLCTKILKKKKNITQQSKKSRKQRLLDIQNSFFISKNYEELLKDKTIILVDDVATTGATINECSRVLKLYGVKNIICLCIASD